jgi:adenine/guanine phosphoribosyltransferase-like PRPP-binding protein
MAFLSLLKKHPAFVAAVENLVRETAAAATDIVIGLEADALPAPLRFLATVVEPLIAAVVTKGASAIISKIASSVDSAP